MFHSRIIFSLALCSVFPAYRHVRFAASVHGFSHGVDQVAADAEVAHLDLALSVDQHVGGLHIYNAKDKDKCFVQPLCRFRFVSKGCNRSHEAGAVVSGTDCVTLF